MKTEKSMIKKVLALILGGIVLLGAGGLAGSQMFPKEVTVTRTVTQVQTVEDTAKVDMLTAQVADLQAQLDVKPEVITEVKEVQSEDLPTVLEYIYNEKGNIEYITNDLDDQEIGMIVDRILLVNDFKALALDGVKKDLFKELDDKVVGDVTLDKKDMEKLRLDSDADEISIEDIDFEDQDATLIVSGTFRQDNSKFKFSAEVEFIDGEYDELGNIDIELVE